MAKKQTRRSISVSRETYERLRAYCETNGMSMSQFVERRVGDFLGATTGLFDAPASADRPRDSNTSSSKRDIDSESQRLADQIFTF
jgi:CubicO group peptidase (beta-lactamase class C family)